MTYTHCPHKVPSLDDDRGWYCSRSRGCFWPKCDPSDRGAIASHDGSETHSDSSDSSYGERVWDNSHIENRQSSDPNPSDQRKFSDSSYGERIWQLVAPYKSKGREYFRYQWGIGHDVKETIHIPGGSCTNPVALKRARQVWVGIHKQNWSVEQTKAFISPWRGHRARL